MPFAIDAEFLQSLQASGIAPQAPLPEGDIQGRRERYPPTWRWLGEGGPWKDEPTCDIKHVTTESKDGSALKMQWITKPGAPPTGSAAVWIHGGGHIQFDVHDNIFFGKHLVNTTGVPFLGVDYRLSPDHPWPADLEDAYAGLEWLHENAKNLGVDPNRIMVVGDSAGGGIAAALCIYAKEKGGPSIAKQILFYPMLDDRNLEEDEALGAAATWTPVDNRTAWKAYLGSKCGGSEVIPTMAPARLTDATGLPPAYIDCGEMDLFRVEDLDYAKKLLSVGVQCEVHIYPGCLHVWELLAPKIKISQRAFENRAAAILSV